MKLKCSKKYLIVSLILFFGFSFNVTFASVQTKTVRIIKDERPFSTCSLYLIDGMGYFSSDDISRIYNAKINWYPASKKVILSLNGKEIIFKINSKNVLIDNVARPLKKPTRFEKGKMLIPLEFLLTKSFSNISNCYNEWDYRQLVLKLGSPVDILPLRYYSYKDKTRLVIQTLEKKEIHIDSPSEKKIVIKVYKSRINPEKASVLINDGLIEGISSVNLERDVSFVVNLGTYAGKYETTALSSPFRLVLDIERNINISSSAVDLSLEMAPAATSFIETNISTTTEVRNEEEQVPAVVPEDTASSKFLFGIRRIVVDAGHGGADSGAIGFRGTKEKLVNLAVAKKLAESLKENGYEVFMTRNEDVFIPLEDRTHFANKAKADLFISIHCNASLQNKTRGFEIYFLSENATDRAAEAVANMENSVIALEKHNNGVKKDIEKLLLAMAVNQFINESSSLCGIVNQEVCNELSNLDNRGVKQANFYVLRGATMPAVLVELAFLSNSKDEKLLNQKKFQKKMVKAIFDGIKEYEKRLK